MNHCTGVTRHISSSSFSITSSEDTIDDTAIHNHICRRNSGCITTTKDILDTAGTIVDCYSRCTTFCRGIVSQISSAIDCTQSKHCRSYRSGRIIFVNMGCCSVNCHGHRVLRCTIFIVTTENILGFAILDKYSHRSIDICSDFGI